jgi:hypothetical protein
MGFTGQQELQATIDLMHCKMGPCMVQDPGDGASPCLYFNN